MIDFTETLIPFHGLSEICLYQNMSDTQRFLEQASLDYTTERIDNTECTISLPWIVLHVTESPTGYWLEDNPTTGLISSMTIFINEIDNDDFEECNW